mmetsp:Transcript_24367/g.31709  ORF Transcript_24367/g.31709 Transcript_24367/m.31709 type:complete len:305 (+) Transcript_24367:53-967(+)
MSAWITHLILAGSWICGTSIMSILVFSSFWIGWYRLGTFFILIATRQFYPPRVRAWPRFHQFLIDLKPRNYYASAKLRFPSKKIEKKNCMLCFHPHGITSSGFTFQGVYAPELAELNISWFVARAIFWLPLFSIVSLWHGKIFSADKNTMTRYMKTRQNLGFIPGGFEEATICRFGVERVYIQNRKGFIKLALRYGYSIYPVYTFGESFAYYTFPYFEKFRLWLNKQKIPTVAFFGNPFCPFLARPNIHLLTCIGECLELPHLPEPTTAQIDHWHRAYVDALCNLFERHKLEAGYPPEASLELL